VHTASLCDAPAGVAAQVDQSHALLDRAQDGGGPNLCDADLFTADVLSIAATRPASVSVRGCSGLERLRTELSLRGRKGRPCSW